MAPIYRAKSYNSVADLCVITAHFNPCNYHTVRENYLLFRQSLEASGISLFTVECAFKEAPFQLQASDYVMQVRSNSVLWQKERLLNIALNRVRAMFAKVAWIDADVFFSNADWALKASAFLEESPVVQLFERSIQLPQGATFYDGIGTTRSSIAYELERDGFAKVKASHGFHGHTGYAWAARSEVLAGGLFDGAILGGADHLMAHAMLADLDSPCLDLCFFTDQNSRQYFNLWAEKFVAHIQANLKFVPGDVLHRWHGSNRNRLYHQRGEKLARFGVDPLVDLCINDDGCWEWQTNRPRLQQYVANYFALRQDDGDQPSL